MRVLMLQWADDLFLHGHDLARWITDYVDLEESMAVGSMSQEDLAHAAALLAADGRSPDERDWRIFERPVDQWTPSTLVVSGADDWPDVVARAYLFSEAARGFAANLSQVFPDFAAMVDIVRAEQHLHVRHWRRWLQILAADPGTRGELNRALLRRASLSADLFGGPPNTPSPGPSLDALHSTWLAVVKDEFRKLGFEEIELPAEPQPRRTVSADSQLANRLALIRSIRVAHPERMYSIYD